MGIIWNVFVRNIKIGTLMKPLRVALIHRDSPRSTNRDVIGWWSYPVPEFQVTHHPVRKYFRLNKSYFAPHYDLIVLEDGKISGVIKRDADIPLAYVIADSTLSEKHYQLRYQQARQNADILLVDWDKLDRFKDLRLPIKRFSFATNDHFFCPRKKTIDIGFFCHPTPERKRLAERLHNFSRHNGYSFAYGVRMGEDYAAAIGSAKININLGRNPQTRSNRIFDVFLSKSCLVCDPLPAVSDEPRKLNEHYLQFRSWEELEGLLDELLTNSSWRVFADAAYELGKRYHTWGQRAKELREFLDEVGIEPKVTN